VSGIFGLRPPQRAVMETLIILQPAALKNAINLFLLSGLNHIYSNFFPINYKEFCVALRQTTLLETFVNSRGEKL